MTDMQRHGLRMVEENEATGELVDLYDIAKRFFQSPTVPNLTKALGMSPAALQVYMDMLSSFYANISLPQSLIAMICYTVAAKSNCVYCSSVHELTCRTLGVDDVTLSALSENLEELNPERIRAIIDFAWKAAKYPQSLAPEDYDSLRNQGISNDEIVQIVMVASVAVVSDIVADALKVDVDSSIIEALGE